MVNLEFEHFRIYTVHVCVRVKTHETLVFGFLLRGPGKGVGKLIKPAFSTSRKFRSRSLQEKERSVSNENIGTAGIRR